MIKKIIFIGVCWLGVTAGFVPPLGRGSPAGDPLFLVKGTGFAQETPRLERDSPPRLARLVSDESERAVFAAEGEPRLWRGEAGAVASPVSPEAGLDEAGAVLFKKVDPTVVAIQHEEAGGSGFIIDPNGYIITNGHVVSSASRSWWNDQPEDPTETAKRITVVLSDERKFQAKVIGHSLDPDVALIKIETNEPLPIVVLGDSENVKAGQRSYAFGMPYGLKRTLTAGIVSNVDRTDLDTFTKVIQTDAPINPGNSGGPLFNEKGEVIGINTYGMWGEGLGFTIPINVAKVMKEHFIKYGKFKRAAFPFFILKEIDNDLAGVLGINEGILVDYVDPGSPADKSGLKNGDIIVALNNQPISASNRAGLKDAIWKFTTQP
ncbi:MAG: trypsin-like peptidase domain-containing protein, partial [Planctomycetota bacterium]